VELRGSYPGSLGLVTICFVSRTGYDLFRYIVCGLTHFIGEMDQRVVDVVGVYQVLCLEAQPHCFENLGEENGQCTFGSYCFCLFVQLSGA
jgi:hypothetical protein